MNNDALKFAVQIVEDDKNNVESLVKKVQLMLDKEFKLKVSDDGALKKLEDMLNVLKSVEAQMGVISKGMSNSSWGKLGEDLNIAIAEFRKLTSSAEEFGKTMSKGFANNLKAELDVILPKLSETSKLINKVKDESRSGDGSAGIITSVQSLREAEAKLSSVLSLMSKLRDAEDAMSAKGFNTSQLERYRQELSQISVELQKIAKSSDGMSQSGLTAKEFLKSVGFTSLTESATRELKSLQDAENMMQLMAKLADEIQTKLGSLSAGNPMRASLESAKQDLEMWQVLIARNPQDIAKDAENRNQKMKEYQNLLDSALQKEREIQKATSDSAKEEERLKTSINGAAKESDRLGRKLTEVDGIIARMKELKLDTTSIEKARAILEILKRDVDGLAATGRTPGGMLFSEYKGSASVVSAERDVRAAMDEANASIRKNAAEKKKAEESTRSLTIEEQKLAQAMRATTQGASLQSSIMSDLRSMAAQYLSVWGAKSFVENMAQITGELELQQKSLEVIIGSATYASQLFGEIRDLSQQSPYTFQDLLKSTRQLAAFGIETKDLYSTMKSLSDIGAGLSVDVQRLILAYGHTRSYGYLSGIQNRQFETAGIDLVGALADRYNKLADAEERAGRAAEHVTRKDVFKMISKKEVGFEDVSAVIMGLDQPGGRFYNMQERQFDTLGGKLRNLRNNYNIMMSEMGKSNHGMLMSGVNMLNELTGHWDKYAKVIMSILVPLGAFKVATLAVNSAVGIQSDVMAKNAMSLVRNQKAVASAVSAMQSGGMFAAIRGGWAASGTFSPTLSDAKMFSRTLKNGYESGGISKSQLMMMGTNERLPRLYRELALSIAGVDKAQIRAIASTTGWQRRLLRLRYSVGMAAASVRAFGAAIVSMAAQMAPFAVIGGIVALYSHFKSMADEAKDALDKLAKSAKEDAKNIDDVIARYKERGVTQSGDTSHLNGDRILGTGLSFNVDKIKSMTASDVEELKQELQKFSPFYEGDLVDIGKFESQAEQVMAIMRKLDSYRHAEQVLAATADNHKESADGRFSWFFGLGSHESFITNLEDMSKAFGNMRKQVDAFSEKQIDDFDKSMGGELSRIKESGAAVSLAEALKVKLVTSLSMSDEDRQKMIKSWNDKDLADLFKRRQIIGRSSYTKTGVAAGYRSDFDWNVKRLSGSLREVINDKFSKEDIDGALKYAIESYEAFASQAKGVSEEVKQYGLQMVLQSVFGKDSKFGNGYREFLNKQFAGEVNAEIERAGNTNIFMSPKEISSNVMEVVERTKEQWRMGGKDLNKITNDTIRDIVNTVLNANKIDEAWKKRFAFTEKDGKQVMSDFGNLYHKSIKEASDYYKFWFDSMKKIYDEQTKDLKNMFVPLKQKWNIEIDPNITFQTKDLDKLKIIRDKVKKMVEDGVTDAATKEELKPVLDKLNAQVTLEDMMKQEGIEFDSSKDKGGRGTYKDKESEVWEQRIRLIQEARREYDYWEKQVGKESAQDKVKKQFENLVGADKVLKPGDLDDLEHYANVLHVINEEVSTRYEKDKKLPKGQKKDTNIANDIKVMRELDNALYNIGKGEFERSMEKFVSSLTRELEELTRKWEIFQSVRQSTGDVALASRLTGITPGATPADLKRLAISRFAGIGIDFSRVLGMSSEEIDSYVESLGLAEEKVKAVKDGLKEWQKAQEESDKSDILNYAKWLGSLADLESIRSRNQEEYNASLEETNRLLEKGKITSEEAERRRRAANVQNETKNWNATSMYANLYSNAEAMSRVEFSLAYQTELDNLNKQLSSGAISISEYTDKVEKLNKVANEFSTSGFLGIKGGVGAYLGGGVQGLLGYYQHRANQARLNGDEDEANKWDERFASLNKMQTAAEQLTKVFSDLASGANMLGDMFSALGMKGAANAFSDAGSVLGGIASGASSLSAFGPYGMAAGAAIGAVTSIAQLGDRIADRRIQKLSDQISHIENTLDTIRSYREKELGYSTGNNLRAIARMYNMQASSMNEQVLSLFRSGSVIAAGKAAKNASAVNAMAAYYGDAVSGKAASQYALEYNLLLEERKKKMQQYNEEAGKKSKDESKLEEYKKDIAELDVQVQQFTEDLMNELWGIDFKGWASQISDALMTAFENGTSMAEAFDDSVNDILRNISKNMLNLAIIEPFMNQIKKNVIGYTDENGVYHAGKVNTENGDLLNDPEKFASTVSAGVMEGFGQYGNAIITASKEFLTSFNDMAKQYGYDITSNGKSGNKNGSNSISQTITEESAGYMTGILAAMHQDGSVRRLQLQMLVGEQVPNIIEMMTVSGGHIAGIDESTRSMMRMMSEGSGRMYERIDYIGTKLDRFASGLDRIAVR